MAKAGNHKRKPFIQFYAFKNNSVNKQHRRSHKGNC